MKTPWLSGIRADLWENRDGPEGCVNTSAGPDRRYISTEPRSEG